MEIGGLFRLGHLLPLTTLPAGGHECTVNSVYVHAYQAGISERWQAQAGHDSLPVSGLRPYLEQYGRRAA